MVAIVNFLTPSPGPNIIEVIDTGGDNEIDVLEIFSEWKDFLLADAGPRLGLPQAFTVIGGEPKSPTQDLGQAFFLHPEWKIRPAERDHRLVINGDIQVLGGVGRVTVDTLGAFTVEVSLNTSTLITNLTNPVLSATETQAAVWDATALEHIEDGSMGLAQVVTQYFGSIYISSGGVKAASFGVGTPSNPVDNIDDALTISGITGIMDFVFITGGFTLTQSLTEFVVELRDESELDLGGFSVNGTEFSGGMLKGAGTGTIVVRDSTVEDLSGVKGQFSGCRFTGNIAFATGNTNLDRCSALSPTQGIPEFDFGAGGVIITASAWSSGFTVKGMADAAARLVIGFVAGGFTIDASNTDGAIFYHGGAFPVTNNTGGAAVTDFSTSASVWAKGLASFQLAGTAGDIARRVFEMAGLDATKPYKNFPTGITVGDMTFTIVELPPGTFTLTRTA